MIGNPFYSHFILVKEVIYEITTIYGFECTTPKEAIILFMDRLSLVDVIGRVSAMKMISKV